MTQSKKTNSSSGVEIGLAIAGLAAIAGGVYLYGTDAGKKKRKEIKGWTLKMKGEVLEKLETLKEVNEEAYHNVVDSVTERYSKIKTIAPEDLAEVVADLKKSWSHIAKIAKNGNGTKKAPAKKKVAAKAKPASKTK